MAAAFRDCFPILSVSDLQRSLAFYRDLLGFEVSYCFPSEGEPQCVALAVDGGTLGLGQSDDMVAAVQSASTALWLYTDDVDEAVAALREGGVRVVAEPADQPSGERVASVADPDDFIIHIVAPSS